MPPLNAGIAGMLLLCLALPAQAAGGHFDVDDATVIEAGHEQVEAWAARSPSEGSRLQHLDGAARAGAFELGLNLDRFVDAQGTQTLLGPQIKWVCDPLFARLSAGVVVGAALDTHDGRLAGRTLYLPATLWGGERLQLHANLGADWLAGEARTRRLGIAAEWAANDAISVIAERSLITQVWASRLGARWNVNAAVSIDVSVARRSAAAQPSYATGLNWDFGPR